MTRPRLCRLGLLALLALLLLLMHSRRPDVARQHLEEAEARLAAGDYRGAAQIYRELREWRPDDPAPALRLAEIYGVLDEPVEGLALLEEAIASGAEYETWGALQVQLWAASAAWEQVIAAAPPYLATHPGNVPVLRALIEAYLWGRDCTSAAATAAQWRAHAPDDADAVAIHALLTGDAATRCPDDRAACDLRWGMELVRADEWTLALCPLERAARAETPNWVAHAWLGETLTRLGHLEAARAHLTYATRLSPDQPLSWLLLGTHLLAHGDPAEARDALWEAHRRDPNNPAICITMAQAQAAVGKYENLEVWMTAALERAPLDADIHKTIARFYLTRRLRQGDFPERAIAGALTLAPEDGEAHLLRGWDWLLRNNNEGASSALNRALSALDKALELDPLLGEAHYLRGLALQQLGRYADAQTAFTRATELGYRP